MIGNFSGEDIDDAEEGEVSSSLCCSSVSSPLSSSSSSSWPSSFILMFFSLLFLLFLLFLLLIVFSFCFLIDDLFSLLLVLRDVLDLSLVDFAGRSSLCLFQNSPHLLQSIMLCGPFLQSGVSDDPQLEQFSGRDELFLLRRRGFFIGVVVVVGVAAATLGSTLTNESEADRPVGARGGMAEEEDGDGRRGVVDAADVIGKDGGAEKGLVIAGVGRTKVGNRIGFAC